MNFLTSKMNNTRVDENLGNNSDIRDKFDSCIHDVCVNETGISERSIKEEPRDTESEQGSIHNYVSPRDEIVDDLTVVTQDIALMTDCIDEELCLYETLVSGECIKQEPCDTEEESGSIHNYVNMKDGNVADRTVVAQELMTDCIDDKVCIYETLISGGLVKQEPYDTEEESESIYNVNMKDEKTNAKGNYVTCCKECGEAYDLYCLKCPMLIRIFNSDNSDRRNNTLPKNFLDLCETASGVGIVALRAIPKGVVFGPFKDLHLPKNNTISKRKLRNKKGAHRKDLKGLNWMQYIRNAEQSSHSNLIPFRYEDELYYRSDCYISMGDKLSMCWDSDKKGNGIQDVEKSYWEPQVYESLDDTYACTLCCVGYKSISHLKAHNSVCIEKRNKKDFCEEIVQCDFCKIYMDKNEYSDYHMDRCSKSNKKWAINTRHGGNRGHYQVAAKPIKCESCGFWKNDIHESDDKIYICSKCKYGTRFKCAFNEDLLKVHEGLTRFGCTRLDLSFKAKKNSTRTRHITADKDDKFACTICPYETTIKSNLKRHHGDEPFVCTLCPYETIAKSNLERHIALHDDDRPFACPLCRYKTAIKRNLKRHVITHDDDRRFACALCRYKTATKSNLKLHIAVHNNDRPFACTLCPYKARTKSYLKQHITFHSKDRPFVCTLCPYKAAKKSNLRKHIAFHYRDGPFACTHCSYKTTTKSSLKRHTSTHNDDRLFACTFCPYKAVTKSNLEQHIARHNDDEPFACTLCPYETIAKSNLERHIALHNNDRPFACTLCPYKARTKSYLKKHIAVHSKDKPIVCPLCPYKAAQKSNLKQHMALHDGDGPFACTHCSYKTTRNSSLKRHMSTHNDDGLFVCTFCPYKAVTKLSVKRHIATHDKNRPFACALCRFRTARNLSLKRHIALYHAERRFLCTLCSYKTASKSYLKRHIAAHNDDKSFACAICPYRAKLKSNLERHIATHNKVMYS